MVRLIGEVGEAKYRSNVEADNHSLYLCKRAWQKVYSCARTGHSSSVLAIVQRTEE